MPRDKYLVMHKGIARWKLNNSFENWLSYKADNSEWWKRLYVWYYRLFDRRYYKGGLKFIDSQLKIFEDEWKGIKRSYVVRDMVYSLHRFGADFQDYWNYDFLNLSAIGKERFVVDKLRYGYSDILCDPEDVKLAANKFQCYKRFTSYYKREVVACISMNDLQQFLLFVNKFHTFIYKPLDAACGKGVKKVSLADDVIEDFFRNNITNGPFIAEQLIKQHDSMSCLHPQSVNTVRVLTFALGNRVEIIAASLRMGVGDSVADNAGSGGIFASIDIEKGIVISKACNYRGGKYIEHPNTGVVILGFQIPVWDELAGIAKQVARQLKNTAMVSWDFAYSTEGWVLVEANTGGDWILLQAPQNKPLKRKLYELIDELKNESR